MRISDWSSDVALPICHSFRTFRLRACRLGGRIVADPRFNMPSLGNSAPAIWFPSIWTGTGTDMFTERLAEAIDRRGYRTRIDWLPNRAEFATWSASVPEHPSWANVVHANSWLSTRFVPHGMPTALGRDK